MSDQRDDEPSVDPGGVGLGDDPRGEPGRLIRAESRVERAQRRGVDQNERSKKRAGHTSTGARPFDGSGGLTN